MRNAYYPYVTVCRTPLYSSGLIVAVFYNRAVYYEASTGVKRFSIEVVL